jgi:hypothetical protein
LSVFPLTERSRVINIHIQTIEKKYSDPATSIDWKKYQESNLIAYICDILLLQITGEEKYIVKPERKWKSLAKIKQLVSSVSLKQD